VLMDLCPAACAPCLRGDCLDALGVTPDERDLGALAGKLDSGGPADAARGSGQQDERHQATLQTAPARAAANGAQLEADGAATSTSRSSWVSTS